MPVLVRRAAAGNEMDPFEMEAALRCSGDGKVADVDRVKRSAEQSNLAAPPVRLRGDSVRMRRAQRSSVKGVAWVAPILSPCPPDDCVESGLIVSAGRPR